MKAITLHQPWASLIAEGVKTIETRSWAPSRALIGQRIAIHAGKHQARLTEDPEAWTPLIEASVKEQWRDADGDIELTNIPTGAVVATAMLVDVFQVKTHSADGKMAMCESIVPYFNKTLKAIDIDPYGDFTVNRYLWILKDIEPLTPPIAARGRQKIWEWNDER